MLAPNTRRRQRAADPNEVLPVVGRNGIFGITTRIAKRVDAAVLAAWEGRP
jgi:hypothetical protein